MSTRRKHDAADCRRLTEEQLHERGAVMAELAEIEAGWAKILERRTWNRLNFWLSELSITDYNDLWYYFLRDVYQQRCPAREAWRRFDRRLDDVLGPDKVAQLRRARS